MRKTALWKDAWRAIASNGRRFAAIAVIVAVGVMMLGGLNSVGRDIRAGLDEFFDGTRMHDVAVVSTLGLDDADHDKAQSALDKDGDVESTLPVQLGSVTLAPANQSGERRHGHTPRPGTPLRRVAADVRQN